MILFIAVQIAPVLAPARATVPPSEMIVEKGPVDLHRFYPRAALREEARATVTATCRVLRNRSLGCRDAKVVWRNDHRNVVLDPLFEQATVQALATIRITPKMRNGSASVGQDVSPVQLNWRVP